MSATDTIDVEAFRRASLSQWEQAAAGWNHQTPQIRAWLRIATDTMLAMAGIARGDRVLDVAAGAGDQTLDIAERVGPEGFVLATDFSPTILGYAKANALRAGYRNVDIQVTDSESMDVDAASFDAAVCRLGLMLFPRPLEALRQIRRTLKPGAGICTVVFSTPEANPCVAILMSTAHHHAGLPSRDPYQPGGLLSLGKPGLVDQLFKNAGFSNVATTKVEAPFRLPRTRDYLDFVQSSASPIQQILAKLDEDARAAAWDAMEKRLRAFETAGGWEGPNELLLTAARR
jgi:SAM-dependent methyltransferase